MNLLEFNSKWKIVGTRLRINVKDLGVGWFKVLKESVEKLSEEAKHGAPEKGKK